MNNGNMGAVNTQNPSFDGALNPNYQGENLSQPQEMGQEQNIFIDPAGLGGAAMGAASYGNMMQPVQEEAKIGEIVDVNPETKVVDFAGAASQRRDELAKNGVSDEVMAEIKEIKRNKNLGEMATKYSALNRSYWEDAA
jgi:hypothetical protein